jgi:hypothetical protein
MTTSAGGINATFDAEAENENAIHSGVNRSHSNAIPPITRSVSAGAEIKGTERRTGAACGQRHSLNNRSHVAFPCRKTSICGLSSHRIFSKRANDIETMEDLP